MKSSGAIILIGLAAVLIVIGATDRAKDVWAAIIGVTGGLDSLPGDIGKGKGPSIPDETPPPNTNCVEGEMKVTQPSSEVAYCCPKTEIGLRNADNTCPKGYTNIQYSASPNAQAQNGCARLKNCHIQGSGQAGYGSYNVTTLPTGFTGLRYAPNA